MKFGSNYYRRFRLRRCVFRLFLAIRLVPFCFAQTAEAGVGEERGEPFLAPAPFRGHQRGKSRAASNRRRPAVCDHGFQSCAITFGLRRVSELHLVFVKQRQRRRRENLAKSEERRVGKEWRTGWAQVGVE